MTTSSTVTAPSTVSEQPTGARHSVDVAYGWLVAVFLVGVLVQVYLAGVGAFGDHDVPNSGAFEPHETLGNILSVVAVVLFLLSLISRPSKRVVIASFVLALLVEVAQHGLAQAGQHHKWIGGLHALDGFVILGLAIWLFVDWRRRSRTA